MNDSIFSLIQEADNLSKKKLIQRLKNCYCNFETAPSLFINYNEYSYKFDILLKFFRMKTSYENCQQFSRTLSMKEPAGFQPRADRKDEKQIKALSDCIEHAILRRKFSYIPSLLKNGARITEKSLDLLLKSGEVPTILFVLRNYWFPYNMKKIILNFAKENKVMEIFSLCKELGWLTPIEKIESDFYEFFEP